MTKIVKLSGEFYFDLDDFSTIVGNKLYLKSQKEAISIYIKDRAELKKILDKEIEVRKAEERVSPFRLDPIEFEPCKDCGKKIPISIPKQGWKRSEDVRCWPCHEKELEEKTQEHTAYCEGCKKTHSATFYCKGGFIPDKKCTNCKKIFWVGAGVSDKCIPCQFMEEDKPPLIEATCQNCLREFPANEVSHNVFTGTLWCIKCISCWEDKENKENTLGKRCGLCLDNLSDDFIIIGNTLICPKCEDKYE